MIQIKVFLLVAFFIVSEQFSDKFHKYIVDPHKDNICMFWKDDKGTPFGTIENLKEWLNKRGRKLRFATNGGMFMEDLTPLGLYIEDGVFKRPLNKRNGKTNFYIKPQGVFCITYDGKAFISTTDEFQNDDNIKYATQSAPMLVVDGNINKVLNSYKSNSLIRSGVGILADGKVVFVLSRNLVSFYEFAQYFYNLKCVNAMFLDGNISEMYLPEKNLTDSFISFGVIIGLTYK